VTDPGFDLRGEGGVDFVNGRGVKIIESVEG